ncbi:MAG: hypothetical protein JXB32_03180 [Deltaproteobacteria bacterium]|nr:hypothetical protein [Deltaproteobacteria bacterium]
MRRVPWFLLAALSGAALGGWLAASCAIDDDIAWGQDPRCSGSCETTPPDSYACDIDSTCTPGDGCIDWDCDEQSSNPDVDDGATLHVDAGDDLGDATSGGDVSEEDDVPDEGDDCVPTGAGTARDAAVPVTLGVARPGLTACRTASGWLRFDVSEGTRFEIELGAPDGAELAFQLYAGTDVTVQAAAAVTGTGTFALEAESSTTYYVRVRAVTFEPMTYAFEVDTL